MNISVRTTVEGHFIVGMPRRDWYVIAQHLERGQPPDDYITAALQAHPHLTEMFMTREPDEIAAIFRVIARNQKYNK